MSDRTLSIMLVRSSWSPSLGGYVERALSKNHVVSTLHVDKWNYSLRSIMEYPPRVFSYLGNKLNRRLPLHLQDIDLLLVVDDVFKRPPFEECEGIPTAYWALDSYANVRNHFRFAAIDRYDYVFVAQKDYTRLYKEGGCNRVYWLPYGCDPEIHKRHNVEEVYDLSFVGHFHGQYPYRKTLIDKLRREYNMYVGQSYFHAMAKVYSQSRMVINVSNWRDLNMRVFEVLSCGRLLLTDRVKNGLEDLFIERKHLVIYDDEGDLKEAIGYYLDHPEERERIAQEGQREVHAKHTYLHRVHEMLKVMSLG